MATLALALALALKFCLHKRLSNLHLHKVRQLPFAGIWQIDIFSFSAAFYLPSQYFLLLLPENNIIKQRRVRIWGWRLKKRECLLPFVHFSLSTLHLPPCHALVFCSELRDFAGPTFFCGARHKSRSKSGLGNWEFRQQRWIHVLFLVRGLFLFRCPLSFVRMPTTPFFAVPFIPIPLPPPPLLHLPFFRFSCRVFYAGAILAT